MYYVITTGLFLYWYREQKKIMRNGAPFAQTMFPVKRMGALNILIFKKGRKQKGEEIDNMAITRICQGHIIKSASFFNESNCIQKYLFIDVWFKAVMTI